MHLEWKGLLPQLLLKHPVCSQVAKQRMTFSNLGQATQVSSWMSCCGTLLKDARHTQGPRSVHIQCLEVCGLSTLPALAHGRAAKIFKTSRGSAFGISRISDSCCSLIVPLWARSMASKTSASGMPSANKDFISLESVARKVRHVPLFLHTQRRKLAHAQLLEFRLPGECNQRHLRTPIVTRESTDLVCKCVCVCVHMPAQLYMLLACSNKQAKQAFSLRSNKQEEALFAIRLPNSGCHMRAPASQQACATHTRQARIQVIRSYWV